jgi:hypothetical protein
MPNLAARNGVGIVSDGILKEAVMVALRLADLDTPALARLLFACPVQPSDHPAPAEIRAAVAAQFRRCGSDLTAGLAALAQEAGDHPDYYVARMRWAIQSVDRAWAGRPGAGQPGAGRPATGAPMSRAA